MADTLDMLGLGERARVVGFSDACPVEEERRMFDLGLLPGTWVTAELKSPSGDPTAYRIRDALIALRQEQAKMILVDRSEPA